MKVEDLIGWRIWRVQQNGYLWSFSYDYAWMPGDVSEGEPGDHDHAGIWAFKDKRRAFQKAVESGVGYVWGSVRLWGHVVEHADGYRASKARIVSLDGGTRDITPEMMVDLCRLYRVPEIEVPKRVAPVVRERPRSAQLYSMKVPPPVARVAIDPPLMNNNSFEPKPDKPWPVIWIVGGMLLLCAAMPLLRP